MAEPAKQQIGDGQDNFGQAAGKAAQAAKQISQEAAKQAAVKGAEATANAAAATVQAGVEGGKAVAEIAAGTAAGGPWGAIISAAWAMRHTLFKDDPCLQDVLINGRNVYLFSTQMEFLDALECIIDNIQWRADASTASRELARNFDKHAFGESVEAIYESLVK